MTSMNALATCFRAILDAISPRAAAERARAAALLLFWNHIEQSLHQLDHLFTLWRTNTPPGASAMRSPPLCEPIAPHVPPHRAAAPANSNTSSTSPISPNSSPPPPSAPPPAPPPPAATSAGDSPAPGSSHTAPATPPPAAPPARQSSSHRAPPPRAPPPAPPHRPRSRGAHKPPLPRTA